jgi:predicted O-linked N-acetylglucosamine transferase (SPINDLY family)
MAVAMGTNLSNLVLDNIINGHPLSETVKQRLENTAEQMGLNYSRLIEMQKFIDTRINICYIIYI